MAKQAPVLPQTKQTQQLSPVAIWGKVITALRTKNAGALFIACGEIDDVSISQNNFIIKAYESNKLILDVPENLKIIQEILNDILPNYAILVEEKFKQQDAKEIAKQNLRKLFGDKLNIIGDKKPWQ